MRFYPNKTPEESIDIALEKLGDVSEEEKKEFVQQAWIVWELSERRRMGALDAKERVALKKAMFATRRGSSFGQLRSINLKMTPELLWKIDDAARCTGMDRSNWIRSVCTAALSGQPGGHHTTERVASTEELLEKAEVIDERAREIVRDLLSRVQKLEAEMKLMKAPTDPFA